MRAHLDGIQVLKGNILKATIYLEPEDAASALALNNKEVEIGPVQPALPLEAGEEPCPLAQIEAANEQIKAANEAIARALRVIQGRRAAKAADLPDASVEVTP